MMSMKGLRLFRSRKGFCFILFILMGLSVFSCRREVPLSERTLASSREQFRRTLIDSTILQTLKTPPDSSNAESWKSACWAIGLTQYRTDAAEESLREVLNRYETLDGELKGALLEIAYGLYPSEFIPEIRTILHTETDPKRFAMAGLYLNRAEFSLETAMEIRECLIRTYKDHPDHPILEMLRAELHYRPPLDDLLSSRFLSGKAVFYTFFRQNRDYPGITIFRRGDGSLVMEKDASTLWHIGHFGRSNSSLPGYLTNGNTPEGLFSIRGTRVSDNVFIGPTPLVELAMPFEIPPADFFHGETKESAWSRLKYMAYFPPRWQDYLPVYTSYYAGKAGRSEIVAHGTTINPEFYANKPWYPYTPSLGCLTALELWDEETGKRKVSDQSRLIDLMRREKISEGFWMVIELNDKDAPVEINDLKKYSPRIKQAVQSEEKTF